MANFTMYDLTKKVPAGGKIKLRFEFEKTGKAKFGAGGIGRL